MTPIRFVIVAATVLSLSSCASMPMGPTVQVLPAPGKPFEVFAGEKNMCMGYAESETRGQADSANATGLVEGVGGTLLGAGLGAAIGGGRGAAIGAAGGAVAGTAVGANTSGRQQFGIQQQYNNAYVQCMVSKGNKLEAPPPQPTNTIIYAPPQPTVIYQQAPPVVVYQNPAPAGGPYPY